MKEIKILSVAFVLLLETFAPSAAVLADDSGVSTSAASAGKQFLEQDGSVWLVTDSGCRKAYTSRGAFESFGFNNFKGVQKASAADMAIPICDSKFILPREGSVVFSSNKNDFGTGYIVSDGKKRGFANYQAFIDQGFKGKKQIWADVSWIAAGEPINSGAEAHPAGTLVNDNGTFRIADSGGSIGIPDQSTLTSWGYDFKDAVPANSADRKFAQANVLVKRGNGQLQGREVMRACFPPMPNSQSGWQNPVQPQPTQTPATNNQASSSNSGLTPVPGQGQGGSGPSKIMPYKPICPIPPCPKPQLGTNTQSGNISEVNPAPKVDSQNISGNNMKGCVPPPCGSSGGANPGSIGDRGCVPPPCMTQNGQQSQPSPINNPSLNSQGWCVPPPSPCAKDVPCGEKPVCDLPNVKQENPVSSWITSPNPLPPNPCPTLK